MKKKHGPGTLGSVVDEIKSGTFISNARLRSSRRKSRWNFLLPMVIFPLWSAFWLIAVEIGCAVHLLLAGQSIPAVGDLMKTLSHKTSLGHGLILFSPAIPTMIVAMVFGNYLVYLFPPARRAMDEEDTQFPGTEYASAQRELKRLAIYTAPIGLALSLLGAWVL